MFFDTLASAQLSLYPGKIAQAIEWLRAQDLLALPAGRQEVEGEIMFAQVIDHETKLSSEILAERHRLYLDVQCVYRGAEQMAVSIETGQNVLHTPYDENRDILFYEIPAQESLLIVNAGQFAVFFPTDVHRPGIALDKTPAAVRKIVVKIRVDSL